MALSDDEIRELAEKLQKMRPKQRVYMHAEQLSQEEIETVKSSLRVSKLLIGAIGLAIAVGVSDHFGFQAVKDSVAEMKTTVKEDHDSLVALIAKQKNP